MTTIYYLLDSVVGTEQPTQWWEYAVKYFGVPGATAVAAFWALFKGWIVSGRELKKVEGYWEQRYNDLKTEATDSIGRLRLEKERWQDMALKNAHIAEAATEKVMSKNDGDTQQRTSRI